MGTRTYTCTSSGFAGTIEIAVRANKPGLVDEINQIRYKIDKGDIKGGNKANVAIVDAAVAPSKSFSTGDDGVQDNQFHHLGDGYFRGSGVISATFTFDRSGGGDPECKLDIPKNLAPVTCGVATRFTVATKQHSAHATATVGRDCTDNRMHVDGTLTDDSDADKKDARVGHRLPSDLTDLQLENDEEKSERHTADGKGTTTPFTYRLDPGKRQEICVWTADDLTATERSCTTVG